MPITIGPTTVHLLHAPEPQGPDPRLAVPLGNGVRISMPLLPSPPARLRRMVLENFRQVFGYPPPHLLVAKAGRLAGAAALMHPPA